MHLQKLSWTKTLLVLLLACLPGIAAAINPNKSSVNGMAHAYGFLIGQEYTLKRIAKQYPDLATRAEIAQASFAVGFPKIKDKLEAQLTAILGKEDFDRQAKELREKGTAILAKEKLSRSDALAYLDEVKARGKGNIDSPLLEWLLAVQYDSDPSAEFLDGFRQRYSTNDVAKAKGIKLVLQMPKSWRAKESERPNTVQAWTSENGSGLGMMILDIRDARGVKLNKKDAEEFVRSGEIKSILSEKDTYIESGNFSLEKQTGYWIHLSRLDERAGFTFYQDVLMYVLHFRDRAIGFSCMIGDKQSNRAKASEDFKKLRPLCHQVLNSITLPQAY